VQVLLLAASFIMSARLCGGATLVGHQMSPAGTKIKSSQKHVLTRAPRNFICECAVVNYLRALLLFYAPCACFTSLQRPFLFLFLAPEI